MLQMKLIKLVTHVCLFLSVTVTIWHMLNIAKLEHLLTLPGNLDLVLSIMVAILCLFLYVGRHNDYVSIRIFTCVAAFIWFWPVFRYFSLDGETWQVLVFFSLFLFPELLITLLAAFLSCQALKAGLLASWIILAFCIATSLLMLLRYKLPHLPQQQQLSVLLSRPALEMKRAWYWAHGIPAKMVKGKVTLGELLEQQGRQK